MYDPIYYTPTQSLSPSPIGGFSMENNDVGNGILIAIGVLIAGGFCYFCKKYCKNNKAPAVINNADVAVVQEWHDATTYVNPLHDHSQYSAPRSHNREEKWLPDFYSSEASIELAGRFNHDHVVP